MRIATTAVIAMAASGLMGSGIGNVLASGLASFDRSPELYLTANEPSQDFKRTIKEALAHAEKASEAGKKGNHDELVQQSRKALDLAKEAQRAGHNERLNEGVYALGEAIEHGKKQQTKDAREHVLHAIMKLSQSADLQIPEGAIPPAS